VGSKGIAQSDAISFVVVWKASCQGEVEAGNEAQQTRQKRKKIFCRAVCAAQIR
jgi:hypothetical protein